MISPEDTKITFFGGANNRAAVRAVKNLVGAEYDVVVCDHDPRESVYLAPLSLHYIESRTEAIKNSQIILTSCRTPMDLEELYFGENGLLELMHPGQYAIDLSFSTPQLAREIYAMATVNEIGVLDAPIVNVASKEQTIAFVGGEKELVDKLAPLFPYFAPKISIQENPGDGQLAAVLSMITFAGSIFSTVEALAIQRMAGFSNKAALNVLSLSCGNSAALYDYAPRIKSHDYSGVISVESFIDCLDVILDTAEDLDLTLPMIETIHQLYHLLAIVGGEDLNVQALALLYEDEKTCSEFGLDWSAAEEMTQDEFARGALGMSIEEFLGENLDDEDDQDEPGTPNFGGFFSQN
jgi:3-hydroxyisobutyrate dehydrogenase